MDHKIVSMQQFHDDAYSLLTKVVKVDADNTLKEMADGSENLKNTWKGKDAGVQIMNVITVYNEMSVIRNSLSRIASTCLSIAAKYRSVQIANGANLESFTESKLEEIARLPEYSDNSDTINIVPDAEVGRKHLENAVNNMETLLGLVKEYKDRILNNWQQGGKDRDEAVQVFDEFIGSANRYMQTLTDVANSVKQALVNYQF